jgi:hypothetical protein
VRPGVLVELPGVEVVRRSEVKGAADLVLNEEENVVGADTGNIAGRAERDVVEPFGHSNLRGSREGMSARVRGGDEEHLSLAGTSRLLEGSEEESRRKAGPTLALRCHLP